MSKRTGVSSLLSVSDLNDYILPSQACILPPVEKAHDGTGISEVAIYPRKPPALAKTEIVSISLKDCLACSGCVTSTELAFIGRQTKLDFLNALKMGPVTVSISPQSVASLALKYSCTWKEMASRLCFFLKSTLKIAQVFDQRVTTKLALSLSLAEFVALPSHQKGPVILSQCPAVVSYIEKNHAGVVDLLSKVKTSQQILGEIIKKSSDVFHVSIVPCYDKKLESFRDEKVIDCVITTIEFEDIYADYSSDFSQGLMNNKSWFDHLPSVDSFLPSFDIVKEGDFDDTWGTGGFLATILTHFSTNGYFVEKKELSKDFIEWHIQDLEKNFPIKLMATCFGFKNIQNMLRKIKCSPSKYSYIEMMACPSACLNGGGQIQPLNLQNVSERYLEAVPRSFFSDIIPWDTGDRPFPFQATFKSVDATRNNRPSWAQVQW